jgi:hypothetical protein
MHTSSRQMPRSYSASTSKKHARISVEFSNRMRSFALRYNRTCVAKLSTIVPVQNSSQSISRNLAVHERIQSIKSSMNTIDGRCDAPLSQMSNSDVDAIFNVTNKRLIGTYLSFIPNFDVIANEQIDSLDRIEQQDRTSSNVRCRLLLHRRAHR